MMSSRHHHRRRQGHSRHRHRHGVLVAVEMVSVFHKREVYRYYCSEHHHRLRHRLDCGDESEQP